LDQILDPPTDTEARKKGDEAKEDEKGERFFKEESIIEDIS
jgi:hypothetical protein